MPSNNLKKIYMASSIEQLNSKISAIPQASAKLLVKSAQKLFDNAELADKSKDEELAYVYYMKYFEVIKKIQSQDEYKKSRKYYDGLLDPKKTKRAIQRAEDLSKSLEYRYEFMSSKSTLSKSEMPSTNSMPDKKPVEIYPRSISPVTSKASNGLLKEDPFMKCQKLFSLIKQRAANFLIVDLRSKKDFEASSMKVSNLINIPEETLRAGLTAEKIGKDLDERSRLLWAKRHTYDHLILCDWATQDSPFPPPISVLMEAITKWDPGKTYKSTPVILDGGYDLFRIMYPMFVINPQPDFAPNQISHAESPSLNNNVLMNLEYPDLDTAFISTPSPDRSTVTEYPSLSFGEPPKIDKASLDNSSLSEHSSLSTTDRPRIDRALKPSFSTSNRTSSKLESFDASSNDPSDKLNDALTSNKSLTPSSSPSVSGRNTTRGEVIAKNVPSIPSRALKPKELLESLCAKQQDIQEEKKTLEESFKIERETLKKLKEIEETQQEKATASDESTIARLSAIEARLNEDVNNLRHHGRDLEEKCAALEKQNEEYRKVLEILSYQLSSNLKINDSTMQVDTDQTLQVQSKSLKAEEAKKQELQEQVEKLRKERKDRERKLKEQFARKEAERKKEEEKAKWTRDTEADRSSSPNDSSRWAERSSRSKDAQSANRPVTRSKGDTYTTRLKSSPRTSPVRGGSNLKRSHSALNLSQLKEIDGESGQIIPPFNRNLKPLESPRRRNINAARQRNFEPKYGSVGPARTGLKNLGNTCYMNSIIQCLNNTAPLAKYFNQGHYWEDINPTSQQNGDVAEEIGAVIRALWCGQYRSIGMWDLKTAVGRYHRPFLGSDQQDSHEFLIMLMDWLHDDLNLVHSKYPKMSEQNFDSGLPDYVAAQQVMEELDRREESIMRSLFHGLHRSQIICQSCHHRSLTFEPFSILTVTIASNGRCSLKDLIQDNYKETKIEYKCSRCKKMQNCIRKMDVWKLPTILIIHLNRFEHDVLMKKKQNYIDFPLENLDFSNYTACNNRNSTFNLYGVSNHYGTIDGGHYTAYCRTPNSRSWCKFDDHEVYDLPRESVRSSAAYILFYETTSANTGLL